MAPRLLVCCEFSQTVMSAFLEKGFDAWSNDIIECEGPYKDRHLKMDARKAVVMHSWDIIIAHPPCTYFSTAQSYLMKPKGMLNTERYKKMLEAKEFFMYFYRYDKGPICIENVLPIKIAELPSYSQMVDPCMFGDNSRKRTCLWLKDLPILLPITTMPLKFKSNVESKWGGHVRSKLSPYLAQAMADQWSPLFF